MSVSQSTSRTPRTAVLAGAGVAGLATLFAFTPIADATPAQPNIALPSDNGSSTSTEQAPAPAIEANYGMKKIRVGVQQKDGSYVPPSSSTVGTKITITQTIPGQPAPSVTHCVTEAGTRIPADDESASFCVFGREDLVGSLRSKSMRQLRAITKPVEDGTPIQQSYLIAPGATVVIKQEAANPGYLVDPASPVTLQPCENPLTIGRAAAATPAPSCDDEQVILEDPGLPPVATKDSATTKEGVAVTIDIAPNDSAKAPIKSVEIVADPKDGTARLISTQDADPAPTQSQSESETAPAETTTTETTPAETTTTETTPAETTTTLIPIQQLKRRLAGSRRLASVTSYKAIYTPKPGFTGVDTFDYSIATANGTATARVTVTVTGAAVAASSTAGSGVSANTDAVAETGAPSGQLLGYGAALVVAGGGAVALGTKRRRGRHAR